MTTGIEIAEAHLGQDEIHDHAAIMEFLRENSHNEDILVDPRNIPWCSAFANACERAAGNKGTGLLNARSFLKYGTPIDIKDAQKGDIVVFARGSDGWSGHVAYFVSYDEDNDRLQHLGGNQFNPKTGQSDIVNIGVSNTQRLLGVRRP